MKKKKNKRVAPTAAAGVVVRGTETTHPLRGTCPVTNAVCDTFVVTS